MRIPTNLFIAFAILASSGVAQDNKLSNDESSMGYDLLFDGTNNSLQTLWHGYRMSVVPDAWTVKTNTPLGPRIENGDGNKQPILTNKKYTNFDLKIDVQTTVNGNSGIFTRYEETAPSSSDRRSGPETQICGPSHPDCVSPKNGFGACYDMFPVASALRTTWYNPPGSWNQLRIIAYDSNYVHYGNGKKLLEYKIGTQAYLTAYNESKYVSDGNNGRYYHIHPGGILLQHHGENGITFRNIKIKELNMHPFTREFKDGKWPDVLEQSFVFGKDPTAVLAAGREALPGISSVPIAPHSIRVNVPADHAEFQAFVLNGRALPHRKIADDTYLVEAEGRVSGVAVIRVQANNHTLTKIVGLP